MKRSFWAHLSLVSGIALGLVQLSFADEYYDRYDLAPRAAGFDMGLQPLGYPTGMIGAVMRRDRILQQQLEKLGQPFNAFPFRRGPDIVKFLGKRRLEGGLFGDMPTIAAAVQDEIDIVGIAKLTTSSVVSRENGLMERLAGKRIGYVEGSSAHHALLQGLNSVGLTDKQVILVPMGVDEMPDALEQGRIEAFAAWEPAPSVALARTPANRIIFRGQSTDFFVFSRDFTKAHPEAAREVVAGFIRSLEWMRKGRSNVEQAARWAMIDGEILTGKSAQVTVNQAVNIARREILDIPSAPATPPATGTDPMLASEFRFLRRLGKIPEDAPWERIQSAFSYTGLQEVMRDKRRYRINDFDYRD